MAESKRSKWPIVLAFLAGILVGAMLYRAGTTASPTGNQTRNVAVPVASANVAEHASAPAPRPSTMQPEPISVPSDPGASYQLLEWRRMPNGHREAMTRREGPSGISFARREIDCEGMRFRYLGEGDTVEEARLDRASPEMGDLTPESISTYVSRFVCAK